MDVELWLDLAIYIILTVYGIYYLKTSLKKYSICVKGECTRSAKIHHFKYIIDGVEYHGTGRCTLYKRVGKVYNIRVDKDDYKDFVTMGFIISPLVWGIIILTSIVIYMIIKLH